MPKAEEQQQQTTAALDDPGPPLDPQDTPSGPTTGIDNLEQAYAYLDAARTLKDLRAAAESPLFVSFARSLEPDVLEGLRAHYRNLRRELQHEVETKDLDRQPLEITQARYVRTRVGPTFRLSGRFEYSGQPFESWLPGSSGGPVFRFFERRDPTAYPVRVMLIHGPHPYDSEKSMWLIQELPPHATQLAFQAVPF